MVHFSKGNRRLFVFIIFFIIFSLFARRVLADDGTAVLVLHSSHAGDVQTESLQQGLREGFLQASHPVELYVEHLDARRFPGQESTEELRALIVQKYSQRRPDGIILSGDSATRFFGRFLQPSFPNTPVVYVLADDPRPTGHPEDLLTGIIQKLPVDSLLSTALTLQPDLQTIHLFTLSQLTEAQQRLHDELTASQVVSEQTLDIRLEEDRQIEDVLTITSQLDTTAMVLIPFGVRDPSGGLYEPRQALSMISPVSGAPVYDFSMALLGEGIVGGPLIDPAVEGQRVAAILLDYWNGLPLPNPRTNELFYAFDDQVLRSFGFSRRDIPADSLILKAAEPVLPGENLVLIGLLGAIVLLLLTIIALMRSRRKSREIALLSYRAGQDSLTQLNNRITLDNDLLNYNKLLSYGDMQSLTMAFIDLDNFREINDRFGHEAGDRVLQRFANHLKRTHVPGLEKVYRFAGDEFIILLKDLNELDLEILEINLKELFSTPIDVGGGQPITVQGSVGLATIPRDTQDMSQLIALADEAMYKAKQTGKNKITRYSDIKSNSSPRPQ